MIMSASEIRRSINHGHTAWGASAYSWYIQLTWDTRLLSSASSRERYFRVCSKQGVGGAIVRKVEGTSKCADDDGGC